MFSNCSSLKDLNLFKFKTPQVTNMNEMFEGSSSLKKINFPNFDINKVTSMNHIFCSCSSLEDINLDKLQNCQKNFPEKIFWQFSGKILFRNLLNFINI